MKDFLGQELKVGDKVVAAVGHGRNSGASLVKGEIVRLTNKMVVVFIPNYLRIGEYERRITPTKLIKVNYPHAVHLFKSVILSGEPWTSTCEAAYKNAL